MEQQKTRSEIRKEDKWDLESVYASVEEFNKEYALVKDKMRSLEAMKETFLTDSKHFKEFLLLDSEIGRLTDKLYTYAYRKSDEDKANATYQELNGRLQNMMQEHMEATAFVVPKLLEQEKETIAMFLAQEPELKPFEHSLDSIMRYKGHHLSEVEEKIISAYSKVIESASEASSYLRNVDIRFGTMKDEEGKEIELTEALYGVLIRSKDRRVRQEAFQKILQHYGQLKNTLTITLDSVIEEASVSARLRHFSSSLEANLYTNNIPVALYNNLITTVHKYLPSLYRYYDTKKELLALPELHLYDTYVSMVPTIEKKYSFEEGQQLVLNALEVLGEEYIEGLEKAFRENWIDKYPNKGKRTGAYSAGSYDTKPFILLNYTNQYDDVSTLAHELGHSMHSYFSNQYTSYEECNYPIFLAEIASTVNELLFSHYMEQHVETTAEKLGILNERLDQFKATLFRQTMFAEFEQHLHELVDQKQVLTSELVENYYYDLNKQYFGEGVVVDDDIRYEYLRIPHFYTPFYVYQYATGISIASYIAKNILENTPGFKEKYLTLLKSGGKDYPLRLLEIIDIDLNDNRVFEEALDFFEETLETFIKLSKER